MTSPATAALVLVLATAAGVHAARPGERGVPSASSGTAGRLLVAWIVVSPDETLIFDDDADSKWQHATQRRPDHAVTRSATLGMPSA